MSAGIEANNARERATIALGFIKRGTNDNNRSFDDCFEMGDGNEVMEHLISRASNNKNTAIALHLNASDLGFGDYNKRLKEAIQIGLNL